VPDFRGLVKNKLRNSGKEVYPVIISQHYLSVHFLILSI
jgi:hypothetical protein